MKIISSAFAADSDIPSAFTCDGAGVNPPLEFSGVPVETTSLVLIMEDLDVPRNLRPDGLFIHWLVWNIPPTTATIAENSEPDGVVGKNTGGGLGYTPPCPPHGSHRYFFRLFALSAELVLPSNATKADILHAMQHNIMDQAELMGRYKRQR